MGRTWVGLSLKLLPAGLYHLTKGTLVKGSNKFYQCIATHCHGRFVLCGETSIQLPRRGLYRRCDMSSRMASGILNSQMTSIGHHVRS